MKRAYVYALCEPFTQDVRYIGVTTDLANRRSQHGRTSTLIRESNAKTLWLRKLASKHLIPSFLVLQETDTDHASEIESDWITYYLAQGANLTNQRKMETKPAQEPKRVQELKHIQSQKITTFDELAEVLGKDASTVRRWYWKLYGHWKGRKNIALTHEEVKALLAFSHNGNVRKSYVRQHARI